MKEENFHTLGAPSLAETGGVWVGKLQSHRGEHRTRVHRAKQRDSHTEDRCRPALTSPRGLFAHPPGRAGLEAEARASVGAQREDWGWRREHSLQGVSAPRLAGRESRKKSGPAEEARDFFFPLCFLVRREMGLRALL